jgi:molybdopterin/thiamine biosynthesis adenylyltransferase
VANHLTQQLIHIELPSEHASYAGQLTLFMLIAMLVRLDDYCPRIEIRVPSVRRHHLVRLLPDGDLPEAVATYLSSFPAVERITIASKPLGGRCDLEVLITPTPAPPALTVWADGWHVYLKSAPGRAPAFGPPNPVGPCVAAGLCAAAIFKTLIAGLPLRPGLRVMTAAPLVLSTYDYQLQEGANPAIPEATNVSGAVLIGAGGIGAALVAAAAALAGLEGDFRIVDGDTIDITSHNRLLVGRPGDNGFKVDLAAQALSFHPGTRPVPVWFEDFVQQGGDKLDLVIVGVDQDRVRREIQATLPRIILNAGTSNDASFRVTRHNFEQGACLSCISRDDLIDHPAERHLARQLGLDLHVLLSFADSGKALPATVLRDGGVLTSEQVAQLAGRPLPEIQKLVCSEVQLAAGLDEPAVSISFLSAIPGFLLLGEVIKEGTGLVDRQPLNPAVNHMFMSALGRPHPALLHGYRDKRQGCDCLRSAYQDAYKRKWRSA